MTLSDMTKRTAAGTLALAVCLGGGALAFAGSANAIPAVSDRSIVIATGAAPYDALAGGPLATYIGAPILLQSPGTNLDATIGYYVQRAVEQQDRVTHAYVLGGTSAVSPDVVKRLERAGIRVDRVSGQDRYATALNIALEMELIADA